MSALLTETCRRGHPWTEENTYRNGGIRYCRACRQLREQAARDGDKIGPTVITGSANHCPNGHPRTEENTLYVVERGCKYRRCRICHNASSRSIYHKRPTVQETQQRRALRKQACLERHGAIISEWLVGKSYQAIGDVYGVTRQYIHQVVQRAGGMEVRVIRPATGEPLVLRFGDDGHAVKA